MQHDTWTFDWISFCAGIGAVCTLVFVLLLVWLICAGIAAAEGGDERHG